MKDTRDCVAPAIVMLVILAYIGWMVLCLVFGIQALVKDGESNCTEASFKWLWFIVVASALFAYQDIVNRDKIQNFKTGGEVVCFIMMRFIFSLSFGTATQYQYIDGCGGKAHETMTIYMWGQYATAICIALCVICAVGADMYEKKEQKKAKVVAEKPPPVPV